VRNAIAYTDNYTYADDYSYGDAKCNSNADADRYTDPAYADTQTAAYTVSSTNAVGE
jgi:hypothetical protein